MNGNNYRSVLLFVLLFSRTLINAQQPGRGLPTLEKRIPLPGVKGRIDHMDVDPIAGVAYVAALGNNSLEVVDLKTGRAKGSIKGLDEPQGVAFIGRHNEILIANGGNGECGFYDVSTLKKTASVRLADDADDVRYDEESDRIYVGYGSGGIAVLDAATHKKVGNMPLPAHPESFQLDGKRKKIWVNLPGSGEIAVGDLSQLKVSAKWAMIFPRANFPMAYDATRRRIIVGYRLPARLVVYDSETGKEIFSSAMAGDADDLYWDEKLRRIYISGGEGLLDVFDETADRVYKEAGRVVTATGGRTSLLVPQLNILLVAARETGGREAAILVYRTGH